MFEIAELGQKLDRATFEARVPGVRERLLDAQFRLQSVDSWYTRPIVDYALKRADQTSFDHDLARIVEFEQMLFNEGTLL